MSQETTVTYNSALTIREVVDLNVPDAANPIINHTGFDESGTLNSTSTPPVTKVACFEKVLVAGAATIDLTALPGTGGGTVDGTGLKVQAIKIRNPAANTNKLHVVPGASAGYNLWGAAFHIILNPGESLLWVGVDHANVPAVAGGAKNIDISDDGAAGTETHEFQIGLG